jgi:hypothetical protein
VRSPADKMKVDLGVGVGVSPSAALPGHLAIALFDDKSPCSNIVGVLHLWNDTWWVLIAYTRLCCVLTTAERRVLDGIKRTFACKELQTSLAWWRGSSFAGPISVPQMLMTPIALRR